MKRIISYTFLFLTLAFIAGCSKTDEIPQPSVKLSSSFEGASVSGGTLSLSVPFSECTVEVAVDCNWDWDYSVQSGSWYAVEATEKGILLSIPENMLQNKREGIIVIRSSNETGIAEGYIKISQGEAEDSELNVTLQGEDTEIVLPSDGGSYNVSVSSNKEWSVESGSDWLKVSKNAEGFEVKADSYMSSSIRSSSVTVTAGDKNAVITVSQLSSVEAMVFEITTDKTSSRMGVLPLGDGGMVNCIIDWGDGTIQKVSAAWPLHFYFDDGVYDVKVYGKVASIDSDPEIFIEKYSRCVTAIKSWGDVGLETMEDAFTGCKRLKSVAAPNERTFAGVKSVDGMFRNCTSLTDIPEGLFRNASEITTAQEVFSGCTSLKSIPADIFDDCKNIRNVSRAFFGCSSLKGESPYTLVEGRKIHLYERDGSNSLSKIEEYSECFGGCTGLDDYATISSDYPEWK